MTVAYWTADREAFTSIFTSPDKFYAAAPYTFWFGALLILVFGPGYFSLDKLIASYFKFKKTHVDA
jgi:putative oxidoreductase